MEIILFLLIIFFPAFIDNEAWILSRFLISIFLFISFFKIRKIKINKVMFFFMIFIFSFFLRTLFSENIFNSLYSVNWYFLLVFSLLLFINNKKIISMKKIYFLSIFISIISILDFINIFSYLKSVFESGMIIGVSDSISDASLWFINGNYLGSFILMSSIPGLIFCLKRKKIYIYNLLISIGLYCTGNTTALGVFLICNLISLSFFKNYRKFLFIGIMFFGFVLTSYLAVTSDLNSSTLIHRSIFFKNAIKNIQENPLFGKAPGMFRYYYYKNFKSLKLNREIDYLPPSHYIHNDYIQLIFEIGIFAIVFLFFILRFIFKNSQKNIFLICLPLLLSMFIQHTLYFEKSMFIFVYILAQFIKDENSKFISENSKILKIIKIFLFMMLLINIFYVQGALAFEYTDNPEILKKSSLLRPGYSFLYTKVGISYLENKDFQKAEYFFKRSQLYDKYWGDMYYRLTFTDRFKVDYENMFKNFKQAILFNNEKKAFEYSSEALFFAWKLKRKKEMEFFKKQLFLNAKTAQEKKLMYEILKKIEKQ